MNNSTNPRRLTAKDAEHAVQNACTRHYCQHSFCCIIQWSLSCTAKDSGG